jgi:hypothetical protein
MRQLAIILGLILTLTGAVLALAAAPAPPPARDVDPGRVRSLPATCYAAMALALAAEPPTPAK